MVRLTFHQADWLSRRLFRARPCAKQVPGAGTHLALLLYSGPEAHEATESITRLWWWCCHPGRRDYQNRVGAWACVHILAEKSAAPVGPQNVAAYARFETSEPVDDLLIGSVDARHAFVQAKRNLTLSTAEGSQFASVIEQFVRQFLSCRGISSSRPWDRILDPAKDLLVLVTTSESSQPLRRDLAAILNRIRGLTASQPITDAATNVAETEALDTLLAHVRRCWNAATGENASDEDVRTLLALMHVNELDVEAGEGSEREAISLLESQVLADRAQSRLAWSTLLHLVADLSQRRSGTDQAGLRRVLEEAGLQLRSAHCATEEPGKRDSAIPRA
jgi:hypothetical protein